MATDCYEIVNKIINQTHLRIILISQKYRINSSANEQLYNMPKILLHLTSI